MTTHGSLFSGGGLIDLGFEWAGIETKWQVEMRPYCLQVLEKRFPGVERHTDIMDCGGHNLERVDVISGGFPCQNISVLGNKEGLLGDKSKLWFEMYRIIRELRPDGVFIENVDRLLATQIDWILSGMEEEGYSCWPILLAARTVGATHRRRRAWILCHRADAHCDRKAMEGVGVLPEAAEEEMARAIAGWKIRAAELASGTVQVEDAAYARIARDSDGLSTWMDRHHLIGNSVVPQIPMLFGCFIQRMRGETR
jgi:DNA (cytosine-5)-methyltransferase 1